MKNFKNRFLALGLSALVAVSSLAVSPSSVYASEDATDVKITGFNSEFEIYGGDGSYIATSKDYNVKVSKSNKNLVKASWADPAYRTVDELVNFYPPTRNQDPYGTCWAFSSVSLAEFNMINKGWADKNVYYSPLHLAYYTYHTPIDPLGGTAGDTNSCRTANGSSFLDLGGNQYQAMRMLSGWMGVANEANYPYALATSSIYSGLPLTGAYNSNAAIMLNSKMYDITTQPLAVKQAIVDYGAVGIAYYADEYYYKNSTYNDQLVSAYYCGTPMTANHAVTVVGWSDYFPAEAFITSPGRPGAWLVRNSWTTETGNSESSYFWLSYYDQGLSPLAYAFDFYPAGTYQHIYQYDGGCIAYPMDFSGYDSYNRPVSVRPNKVANIFTARKGTPYGETLSAVMLSFTECVDTSYTVSIYKNLKDKKNPTSGTLASKQSGRTDAAGIYTVSLANPVELAPGETYAVVVSQQGGMFDVEASFYSRGEGIMTNVVPSGKSYMYYNKQWINTNSSFFSSVGIGDICIKAITNDSTSAPATSISSVENTDKGVKITWKKVNGISSYTLQKSTNKKSWKNVKTVKGTSYVDKSVKKKNGKKFYYRVVLNSNGIDKISAVQGVLRLNAPANLKVTNSESKAITVKYGKNAKAKGYQIQFSTKKNFKSSTKTVKLSGKGKVSKTIKGLKKGKTYYVRVRAYKGKDFGAWSKTVKIKISK